ncbi:multifunctional CCA addition/repair protein [Ostreibacterium oceani]|uniref:Multifunctional CCA addition/repair protein n=1 Tax=Ostreibacterium oceani TaxID=2654998 RepID=A0A6N7EQJ1_9GAMM|nr:multifunctional CCA addition/repair protein [Ostreibacterium oceani]MPV85124.1 multifunctional CCA addition/repair protein [Ostreibacterium oceani]
MPHASPDLDHAQIYLVGGAIRDRLLGLTTDSTLTEHDYVVVNATPAQMLAAGFQPVGKDFPVFLHPESHEEYALARTERKQGQGYHGFAVNTENVTLTEDLQRRDLTINAIAEDSHGQLIDPFNGQRDIEQKILRHVSDAFTEDPVRILRIARFAARFHELGFTVADETMALMKSMVNAGEVHHLVPERITKELFKALSTDHPDVFFMVLRECGALAAIFPEVDALFGVPQRAEYHPEIDTGKHVMLCLADAAQRGTSVLARYAVLCHDLGKATTPPHLLPRHHGHEDRGADIAKSMSNRLKVPKKFRDLAVKTAKYHTHIHRFNELTPKTILSLLKAFGVQHDTRQFAEFIQACIADVRGRSGYEDSDYPKQKAALKLAYQFQQFDTTAHVDPTLSGAVIGQRIHQAQLNFIKHALSSTQNQTNTSKP